MQQSLAALLASCWYPLPNLRLRPRDQNSPRTSSRSRTLSTTLRLLGGPKNDVLVAAARDLQMLSGFEDADHFVLTPGAKAVIADFTPGIATLEFENADNGNGHLHVRGDHHGYTVVKMGHDHVVVLGVLPSEFHAEA